MAKVKFPFFSLTAHGSIGRAITMQVQRGSQHCKRWSSPDNSPSLLQQARRSTYAHAAHLWESLPPAEKATYEQAGRARNITAYAQFLSTRLESVPTGTETVWDAGQTTWDTPATVWLD